MMPDESYPWWIIATVSVFLLMILAARFAPVWAHAIVLLEFVMVVVQKIQNENSSN